MFTGFPGAPLWQRKAGPAVHGPCFSLRESSIEASEIRFLRLTGPVRLKKPFLRPPRGPPKPRNEYASYRHTRFGVLGPRPAAPEGPQRQPGGLEVAEWAVLIIKEPRLKYASTGHT